MTLAINIADRHGLSNKVCHELLSKKSKIMLYVFAIHFAVKLFNH